MSAHLNDQELIESLQAWWKKFGNYVVVVILALAVAIAVWRYWENDQAAKLQSASNFYQMMLNDLASNKTADAINQANYIVNNYAGTGYADMAALFLAQNDVNQNNLAAAQQQLQNIAKNTSSDQIKAIANLRLARVDLAMQQPNAALDALNTTPKGYEVSYNLVRGDAYAQMQHYAQANTSYQAALQAVDPADKPLQNLIHLRLNTIPATN